MKRIPTPAAAIAATFVCCAMLPAQRDPDEFLRLEPVLRAAMTKASKSVVTVETFGGARRILDGEQGSIDGASKPRPKPELPKPQPRRDDEEEREQKKKLVLATPGFHQSQGRGTGVVLSADGWILVSRFALNFDPTTILVTDATGKTYYAERMGEDTSRGIALVKIDAKDLQVPTFVDPERVNVGDFAFVLGRTFGIEEPTVHFGIVSARKRQFGRALQIDAYTSPANYGGPVIDVNGDVLGVAVPLSPAGRDAGVEWYDSGIGFCATIADIAPVLEKLKAGEILHRGWLGVQLDASFSGPGAKLAGVPKAGAAAKADLRKGDIVLEIDGVAVKHHFHFQMLLGSRMGGETVKLKVQNKYDKDPVVMDVTLLSAPYAERRESTEGGDLPPSFPLPDQQKPR